MIGAGQADLPRPGAGHTAWRHRAIADVARRHPVSVARLFEAHTDAVAILAEAGRDPIPGAIYGVWASAGAVAYSLSSGFGVLTGTMPYASGLGICDRALVTASSDNGDRWLTETVATPSATLETSTTRWATPAMASTVTGEVDFRGQPVSDAVGTPGFYLDRVGFWHGACGPAAAWAGAALGLLDHAETAMDDDPHRRAHLGAMRALGWSMEGALDQAGHQIDADPDNAAAAQYRARALRRVVERSCWEIIDRFGSALGPRPFTTDSAIAARVSDLHLYLRQDHAERDLRILGDLPAPPDPTFNHRLDPELSLSVPVASDD